MPKFDTILPEGFDGTFRFTNATDEDFVGKWGGREYLYPAQKTTPMVIYDATPLETQNIRKKFAKDLAEREFFKSKKYEVYRLREGERDDMGMIKPRGQGMSHAGSYNEDDLQQYIQQCLTPLPTAIPMSSIVPKEDLEEKLTKDKKGNTITNALDDDSSSVFQQVETKRSLKNKAMEGK